MSSSSSASASSAVDIDFGSGISSKFHVIRVFCNLSVGLPEFDTKLLSEVPDSWDSDPRQSTPKRLDQESLVESVLEDSEPERLEDEVSRQLLVKLRKRRVL